MERLLLVLFLLAGHVAGDLIHVFKGKEGCGKDKLNMTLKMAEGDFLGKFCKKKCIKLEKITSTEKGDLGEYYPYIKLVFDNQFVQSAASDCWVEGYDTFVQYTMDDETAFEPKGGLCMALKGMWTGEDMRSKYEDASVELPSKCPKSEASDDEGTALGVTVGDTKIEVKKDTEGSSGSEASEAAMSSTSLGIFFSTIFVLHVAF